MPSSPMVWCRRGRPPCPRRRRRCSAPCPPASTTSLSPRGRSRSRCASTPSASAGRSHPWGSRPRAVSWPCRRWPASSGGTSTGQHRARAARPCSPATSTGTVPSACSSVSPRWRSGRSSPLASSDGSTRAFQVVERRLVLKPELPVEEVFARSGPPSLVLVTCGGEFDRSRRRYRSNVVVVATPVR